MAKMYKNYWLECKLVKLPSPIAAGGRGSVSKASKQVLVTSLELSADGTGPQYNEKLVTFEAVTTATKLAEYLFRNHVHLMRKTWRILQRHEDDGEVAVQEQAAAGSVAVAASVGASTTSAVSSLPSVPLGVNNARTNGVLRGPSTTATTAPTVVSFSSSSAEALLGVQEQQQQHSSRPSNHPPQQLRRGNYAVRPPLSSIPIIASGATSSVLLPNQHHHGRVLPRGSMAVGGTAGASPPPRASTASTAAQFRHVHPPSYFDAAPDDDDHPYSSDSEDDYAQEEEVRGRREVNDPERGLPYNGAPQEPRTADADAAAPVADGAAQPAALPSFVQALHGGHHPVFDLRKLPFGEDAIINIAQASLAPRDLPFARDILKIRSDLIEPLMKKGMYTTFSVQCNRDVNQKWSVAARDCEGTIIYPSIVSHVRVFVLLQLYIFAVNAGTSGLPVGYKPLHLQVSTNRLMFLLLTANLVVISIHSTSRQEMHLQGLTTLKRSTRSRIFLAYGS